MDQLDQEVDYMDTQSYTAYVQTLYDDMRKQVERLNLRRS
jgi:hypothetical protein